MSYSRFSNADVYVFVSTSGLLECCGCILQDHVWVESRSFFGGYLKAVGPIIETRFASTQAMIDHLATHRAAGHDIPSDIEADLLEDDAENFQAVN